MRAPLRELFANLLSGLRLALFLPLGRDAFRASAGAFVALALFNVLAWFAADAARVGAAGEIQWAALEPYLAQMALVLLAAFVAARMLQERALSLHLAVMWIAPMWVFELFATIVIVAAARGFVWPLPESAFAWLPAADTVYWIWLLAVAVRAVALLPSQRRMALLAAAGLACALATVLNSWMARPELWRAPPPAPVVRAPGIEQEVAFHTQARLLDSTLGAIHPGRDGVVDLYFLGVAAYGAQDVFLREALSVRSLFDEHFDTAGRSALLINNNSTLADAPIATLTNLRAALHGYARRMNREEDVLFLFITTHGDEQHQLQVDLWPLVLEPITPLGLEQALRASGIKWKVVVISACFSGGFVETLRDPYTVVITAADARSSSFGCAHENDWTYFGAAYFDQALRRTRSFIDAFDLARHGVTQRELAEQLKPSNPQIAVGESIRERLRGLQARLERDR